MLPPLPIRFRPLGVRIAAYLFIGLLMITVVVIAISFSPKTRSTFGTSQIVTLVAILAGILAALYALSRSRIDATEAGLVIVNGYRKREIEWPEVVRLSLKPGAPWLVFDLADGNTMSAMGIQGSDGRRAQRQFVLLGALVEAHTRTPRDD